MIVPPQMFDPQGAGPTDPLTQTMQGMNALGVNPAHQLMAAATMSQDPRVKDIMQNPGSFKNKIEMQRTLDQLNGPRQAPAVKPGTKTPRGVISSRGYKRHG